MNDNLHEGETSCLYKSFFAKTASGLVNCENNNINFPEKWFILLAFAKGSLGGN